ncbi:SIMPL domain-containing protein [Isoalcanivorax indicus]|uniref:SIMPL domain-containing protein n=1 Tax=Isoalcanivorax indicus TaxID=2202653 RepID=UPI000DBACE1C|nr:SIMPL domain-containing protein [Isoalcanivorax indicus]
MAPRRLHLPLLRLPLLPLLLLASASLIVGCGGHTTERDTVEVAGYGEIKTTPDRFRVRAVSSRSGDDIPGMKQEVDSEIRAALSLAEALGLPERQVRATGITIQPEWQWQPERKLIGHRVARDIELAVDGIEAYADLLEGLTQLGFTELHQASAELADPQAHEREVLQKAVANARDKAETLAQAAGRELGEAVIIREQSGHQGPQPMLAMARESADTSSAYSAGEITLTRQVQVRFELK